MKPKCPAYFTMCLTTLTCTELTPLSVVCTWKPSLMACYYPGISGNIMLILIRAQLLTVVCSRMFSGAAVQKGNSHFKKPLSLFPRTPFSQHTVFFSSLTFTVYLHENTINTHNHNVFLQDYHVYYFHVKRIERLVLKQLLFSNEYNLLSSTVKVYV